MAEDSILRVNQIDVFYNGLQAIRNVSLEVAKGEIVALVGSNGAGKSTVLRAISGAVSPQKGSIEFEGRRVDGLPPYQMVEYGIAHVPEGRSVFPELTVFENLNIGSFIKRARAGKSTNLKKVYEFFPRLKERKDQIANTLSGGEQQMLAIGRALMSEPRLILFDEISTGLAPIIVDDLYNTVRKIQAEGISILIVEQNTKRILKEAERAYFLETGQVVLSGATDELDDSDEVKKAYFGVQ